MGKMTQKKREIELLKEQKYANTLSVKKFFKPIRTKEDIQKKVITWFKSFRGHYINYEKNEIENFKVLSFNEYNLKIALIKFMYVIYPVPDFILHEFIKDPIGNNNRIISKFFFDITTGKSFYKENNNIFLKKEAHYFLTACGKRNLKENILWARCKYRGILSHYNIFKKHNFLLCISHQRYWISFFDFVAKNKERKIIDTDIHDMIDYISRNPNITFKGRTWDSLKRLSKRWHVHTEWSRYAQTYQSWEKKENFDWEYEDKRTMMLWSITELLNTNELLDESHYMHHCVVSYANSCAVGGCRIFSLQKHFLTRPERCITIQLNGRNIVQYRGKHNRKINHEELTIIQFWAKNFRLTIQ